MCLVGRIVVSAFVKNAGVALLGQAVDVVSQMVLTEDYPQARAIARLGNGAKCQ